ncbi:MAG: phosphoribosyltransferase family protein [Bacillota bacterium]|nr:phosphoribosyltransferase family protein [Bacillota bacterium]MDW7677276.1 phosphoribosyltransferase family protein [Bacillota bacterium]
MEHYELQIAGLKRRLPIVQVSEGMALASFVILGDCELVQAAAPLILEKLPPVDYLLTAEAKGIPLVHEMCRLLNHPYYVVARKSLKPYMEEALMTEVVSITTQHKQHLYLNGADAALISGKRVAVIDDVISSGESLNALERLAKDADARVVARAAILAEGFASDRDDILFLEELPFFPIQS